VTNLVERLVALKKVTVTNAPEGVDALVSIEIAKAGRDVLFILPDDATIGRYREFLKFFSPDLDVLEFPAWDSLPYDRVSPSTEILDKRVTALTALAQTPKGNRIILTTFSAVLQRIPPRAFFINASMSLVSGECLSIEDLKGFLIYNSYQRVETVHEPGEFAIRGGIIDLFALGEENPVRLDFFGDELERIRIFDPVSQLSKSSISSLSLGPASEVSLDETSVTRFRSNYRIQFSKSGDDDPLYQSISENRYHVGMEHWLPLFHDTLETIFDYLPSSCVLFDHQANEMISSRLEIVYDYFEARKNSVSSGLSSSFEFQDTVYRAIPPNLLYLDSCKFKAVLKKREVIIFQPFTSLPSQKNFFDACGKSGRNFIDVRVQPNSNVFDALRQYVTDELKSGKRVLIAATSKSSCARLITVAREHKIHKICEVVSNSEFSLLDDSVIGVTVLGIEKGFSKKDLTIISEQDLLGERLTQSTRRQRKSHNLIVEASSLTAGELIVHIEHGIARFSGLKVINVGGAAHDCLELIYADNDKLFLPVENIELISRYGSENLNVSLDKLGSTGWQNRKSQMNARIRLLASELIKIAADRELKYCDPITPPSALYEEFAARFPFIETDGQYEAISDVFDDLLKGRPTERLICGDVGFGKTEVGLRAAFTVAMEGKQVAVVVPTTLLCRQHFDNFCERFMDFPVRVEQISRLVSVKKVKEVKKGLVDGSVDIVIGTHALLTKDIEIKNLGLLIIDEEQHFGVSHKERLKKLKSDIHVLTLTATPIPRTLQLALTGIRDMSIIATPPIDRLAVRTFISPFDPVVIREAILRENFRGGQIFYVCPRIADLELISAKLRKITPEIKFSIVHGKMPPKKIEDTVECFYNQEIDLLLTTNIIESGLDLPQANTIIIHRSDMFGLSQLYQLRGRVGRSKIRAYAYLTLTPGKKLTLAAKKRLEVMQTLDGLGAGFSLASYDLDIRGSGNLLGGEQSGHIREVGVELYHSMLEKAVIEARDSDVESEKENWTPQVGIGLAVMIPDTYVSDLGVRMGLYRRLSLIEDKENVDKFAVELQDRFGELPQEAKNLLSIVILKQLCKKAGIIRLEAGPRGALVSFYNNDFDNPEGLVTWLHSQKGTARLRPDHKIIFNRSWEGHKERMDGVSYLVNELIKLRAQ